VDDVYKKTEYPVDNWDNDKIDKLIDELIEINVLTKIEGVRTVSSKFRDLFKMLLHDIVTENKEMDEHKGAIIAVIQLLKEFGAGTLSKDTRRDDAILLNEGWLYIYAHKIREAREFMRTKKLFFIEEECAAATHLARVRDDLDVERLVVDTRRSRLDAGQLAVGSGR